MTDIEREINVLLVEDNAGSARLTTEALLEDSPNLHVTLARDGVEAMEILALSTDDDGPSMPDLILLDLNLPRKSGWEVLKALKHDPSFMRIPVVVLTSSDSECDILAVYELYGNCFMTKPGDLDAFFAAIQALKQFWFEVVQLPSPEPREAREI